MAKNKAVSFNPDDLVQAGLADDFDGEITEVRYVPWDYDGHLDHHVLAARVTIIPDEESGLDEFTQHYSAGDLQYFVPSVDGENPVDLDADDEDEMAGPFVVAVGRREGMSNSSNWAQFAIAAVEAGFPKNKMKGDVSVLEGVKGHFNRVAQMKRSGIQVEGEEGNRRREVLVLTEVYEHGGAKKSGAKSGAKKSGAKKSGASKKAADDGAGELSDRLAVAVLEAVADADGEISKTKLPGLIIKSFEGAEKARAVKLVSETSFLSTEQGWTFDEDTGDLSLG